MIKLIILSTLLLSACSIKTPTNDWQRKSTTAFNSYTKNFLQANNALSASDLSRAITHAKQSANLTQLGKIYLGECALNISAGIHDDCKKYKDISNLIKDNKLEAYYSLLNNSLQEEQIKFLPSQYQDFSLALIKKDEKMVNTEILQISKTSSLLLSASLAKKLLNNTTKEHIIQSASFNGYKKIVLFWLENKKQTTNDTKIQQEIEKRISILKSNH